MGKRLWIRIAAVSMMITLSTVSLSFGQPRWSLRLNGGLGWLYVGDTNENLTGLADFYTEVAQAAGGSVQQVYETFHWGQEGEGEILFRLNPRWEIGAGAGYLVSSKHDNRTQTSTPGISIDDVVSHDIKARFVTLDLIHHLPLVKGVNLLIRGGMGYYFAGWAETGRYAESQGAIAGYWRRWDLDTDGNSFGFHGSLGLEIPLLKRLSVLLEGFGRWARIAGLRGDGHVVRSNGSSSDVADGTLYYFEWKDPGTGNWYADVNLLTTSPSGANNRDAREAAVDLTGAQVKVGLIIRLF